MQALKNLMKKLLIQLRLQKSLMIPQYFTNLEEKAVIKKDRVLSKYETKLGTTKIDCMVIKPKSIFVAHDGLVFPCCFTASKYYGNSAGVEESQLQDFINEYGTRNISLEHNHLRDIIDGPMFQGKWSMKVLKTMI